MTNKIDFISGASKSEMFEILNETFYNIASIDYNHFGNIDDLLTKIVDNSRKVLSADLLEFYEYRHDQNKFSLPQVKSGKYIVNHISKDEILEDDIMHDLIKIERPLFIEDSEQVPEQFIKEYTVARADVPKERFIFRENIRSLAVVPIRAGNENVGLMFINYRKPIHFTAEQKQMIRLLAGQTAIVIKNARLYHQLFKRREALIKVGKNLTSKLKNTSEEFIFNTIYMQSKENLGMTDLSLALYNSDIDKISFKLAIFNDKRVDTEKELKIRNSEKGKTGWVVRNKKLLYIESSKKLKISEFESKFFQPGISKGYSWLGVPMTLGERLIGVLATHNYQNDYAFSKYDIDTFQALADIAAIAIHNVELYTNLEKRVDNLSTSAAEEKHLLHEVIDNIPAYIYAKDLESRFVMANEAVAKIMRAHSPDELINKRDFDFYPINEAEKYYNDEQEIIKTGNPIKEKREISVDGRGKTRVTLTTKVPWKNEKDLVIGTIGLGVDITKGYKNYSLIKIAEAAYNSENLVDFYAQIHDIINALIPAKNLYVGLYNSYADTIEFPYFEDQYKKPSDNNQKNFDISIELAKYVFEMNKPFIASSEDLDLLEKKGTLKRAKNKCRYWMGVPLRTDHTFGLLVVQTYDEHIVYDKEDLDILEFVSHSIATAIEKHIKEARRKISQASAIEEIAASIISKKETTELISGILSTVKKLIDDANHSDILVYDEKKEELNLRWSDQGVPKNCNLKIGEGITGWVAKNRNHYISNNVTSDRESHYKILYEDTESELAVPIIRKTDLIGVLNIESNRKNAFNDEDIKLTKAIANLAAVAIHNKNLFFEVETLRELSESLSKIS